MHRAGRRRTLWAVTASVIAHAAVLGVLAVQRPMLRIPEEPGGPPEAIIPVLILPRVPPPAANSGARPSEVRLHRRPQRFAPPELPVAPLIVPTAPTTAAPKPGPVTVQPAPAPAGPPDQMRAALRLVVGCADPDAAKLTPAERDRCNERLGAGAKTAPFEGMGMAAAKQSAFDRAAAHKDACRAYRASPSGEQPRLRDGLC